MLIIKEFIGKNNISDTTKKDPKVLTTAVKHKRSKLKKLSNKLKQVK